MTFLRLFRPNVDGCHSCVYWQGNNEGDDTGRCRLVPPVMVRDEDGIPYPYWPQTYGHRDWCGSWRLPLLEEERRLTTPVAMEC